MRAVSSPTAAAVVLVAAGLVVALIGAPLSWGAYADADASERNALRAGSLDLKLAESGPTNGHGSTTDENETDVVYDTWEDTTHATLGGDTVTNTLTLNNTRSTLDADGVNLSVEYAESDGADGNAGNAMNTSKTIEVTEFTYAGEDLTGNFTDTNGDNAIDVDDLTRDPNTDTLSGLSGVPNGGTVNLTVSMSGAADLIDGVSTDDGVDITVTVEASKRSYTDADVSKNSTIRYG